MIEKADILGYDLTSMGDLRVKVGNSQTGEGRYDDLPVWGVDGFISRALPADNDGACMALVDVTARRVTATKDNRITRKYGSIADGDKAIVGYRDHRFLMKHSSDSVSLLTKNHSANDDLMILQLNGDKGELSILIGGSSGPSFVKVKSGVIHMSVDGGGSLTIDKTGVHITGAWFDCATAGGNLGTLPGGAPLPPLTNSVLAGPTGIAGMPAPKWTVATA